MIRALVADGTTVLLTTQYLEEPSLDDTFLAITGRRAKDSAAAANGAAATRGLSAREG